MKKSLLAVAAMGAFASAAHAQSSVTVYGILDVGYVGSNTRASGQTQAGNPGPGTATQTGAAVIKSTGNTFTSSPQQTSRLGFKGTEDLGGGASAFFTIEMALAPNSNQNISTSSSQNRQTFIGLQKKGIGAVSAGTQYTPIHIAVGKTDPGQQNQMVGNIIYSAYTGSATALGANSGSTDAYTTRTSNQLKFVSDNFAGFQGTAIVVANNQNNNQVTLTSGSTQTVVGGINNQNGWGLGADYTWNKLLVTANYQAFTSKNPATTISTTTSLSSNPAIALWNTASGGSNVQDNQAYLAATYDFGILKAYAQWSSRKATAQQNNNYYVKRQAQQIGVRSFITPTIEAWASIGNGRYTAEGLGSPTANLTAWQLGSNYWLSKRTNLYAIYGQSGTSNVSVTNGGNPQSYNANAYALGMRHTF